jgi:hypothetical protein
MAHGIGHDWGEYLTASRRAVQTVFKMNDEVALKPLLTCYSRQVGVELI